MKIKSLKIAGIRGIRQEVKLRPEGKSVLIYGDNGAGKSSLTDSFEWYYEDGVDHLSSEEIGRRGRGAIRNNFLSDDEPAYVDLQFSLSSLNARKTIGANLSALVTNSTPEYLEYIEQSRNELLILRYKDLVNFIVASKKEKLDRLQDIIGYGEVANLRDLLKKSVGRIKRNLSAEGLENRMATFQSTILESLGANANSVERFVDLASELLKPLELQIDIKTTADVSAALELIGNDEEDAINQTLTFLNTSVEVLTEFSGNVDRLNADFKHYRQTVMEIRRDESKLQGLKLLALLRSGISVLEEEVLRDDFCPLCLQEKNKLELVVEVKQRIETYETLENEKITIDEMAAALSEFIKTNMALLKRLSDDKKVEDDENVDILRFVNLANGNLDGIAAELKINYLNDPLVDSTKDFFEPEMIAKLISQIASRKQVIEDSKRENKKFAIYRNLFEGLSAFKEYQKAAIRKAILERQQRTLNGLFLEFVSRQEVALNALLASFSLDFNSCYTQINPTAKIENIKLLPLNDARTGELVGVTIQYDFFEETKQQPTAYLSESHLNCLGISFFLASVKAFNKVNKFFILDDVVSSFDRPHRSRFARFIADKLGDYQVILLTHERDFFDLVSSETRGKGWEIQEVSWSRETGAKLEETVIDLKEKVERKIAKKNIDGLGNDIRIFLENALKGIVFDIGGRTQFRYNDLNEKRMPGELFDVIQARLSKKSAQLNGIIDIEAMKRRPLFMANILSHDNSFVAALEDYELMWQDIQFFVSCFKCPKCKKNISDAVADKVRKIIRCRCSDENLSYDWK